MSTGVQKIFFEKKIPVCGQTGTETVISFRYEA
jgi:hypothetical protein